MSTMSEASNYTGGSDYSTFPGSPAITVTTATATSTSSTRVSVLINISNSISVLFLYHFIEVYNGSESLQWFSTFLLHQLIVLY